MSTITITLDEAQLGEAEDALHAAAVTFTVKRPVKRPATAAAMPSVDGSDPFHPDTGDPGLDAFMRRTWTYKKAAAHERRVKAVLRAAGIGVAPAPLKPRKWTRAEQETLVQFNRRAVEAWRRLGHEVIVDGPVILGDFSNVTVRPLPDASNAR